MIGAEPTSEVPLVRLRVAIRADASLRIGAGHVMRCLALAQALRAGGHDVLFIMREADGDLRDVVANGHAFPVLTLPAAPGSEPGATDELTDARQTLASLDELPTDWVVVDHYSLGAHWEAHVSAAGPLVLAIDDNAIRDHTCALLLDHNLVQPAAYAARTASATDLLLGLRYALLRTEFALVSSLATIPEVPRTVLVSFGGTDPTRQTTKALHAIRQARHAPDRLIVIAGRDHPDLDHLQSMAAGWPALDIHTFVTDPAALLRSADLAIGAGGVSALERLVLGVPSIVLTTASNQEPPAEALAQEGTILYLGPANTTDTDILTEAINTMANRHLRAAMRRRGVVLLDGEGPDRVVRAMLQRTPVSVRVATCTDRQWVFAWRNHPAIRATAFDPSEIPQATHDRWFEGVLTDPDRHLLVAEHHDNPIGVVRYDLDRANATAELSMFLAPEVHGLGLGRPALVATNAWLTTHEPDIERIRAHVLGSNHRSRRLFESAGFCAYRTSLELERSSPDPANLAEANHGGT
jgi:UDP-2,4-diacetamido-2,4,6-trideoxy-beta-L-altropyranose hydrolase